MGNGAPISSSITIAILSVLFLPLCMSAPNNLNALNELRNGLDPDSSVLKTWNETNNCSQWLGLTCNGEEVVGLNITSMGLLYGATLSSAIGNLTSLKSLDLSSSELTGDLPSEVGKLKNLEKFVMEGSGCAINNSNFICELKALVTLKITNNGIAGSIPSCIGNLTSLEVINLSSCGFTSPIPDSICKLTNATSLNLENNQLNGTIPTCIGDLTSLTDLTLSTNSISGALPKSIGKLTNMKELKVNNANLEGQIPDDLCSMEILETLYLNYNQFTLFPSCIGSMTQLQNLNIASNQFEGNLPSQIFKLQKLISLTMSVNKFTGSLSSDISNLINLVTLDISENSFVGQIPNTITQLVKLQSLLMNKNIFNGSIPEDIGNLKNLKTLNLRNNNLTGVFPSSLSKLSKLNELHLAYNHLEGNILDTLVNLNSLTDIELSGNVFSGKFPDSFGKLAKLSNLDLSYNNFEGTIPSSIANFTGLVTLNLGSNQFSGALPPLINMASIGKIFLQNNQLTGTVPDNLLSGGFLSELNIENNNLTGDISFVKPLTYLQKLIISNNQISGAIPSDLFVNLQQLLEFNADNNLLTGSLPELYSTSSITKLSLQNNKLTGEIPTSYSDYSLISYLNLKQNQITGSFSLSDQSPTLEYLFLDDNPLNVSLSTLGIFNIQTIKQISIPNCGLFGKIPSLSKLINLLRLDLSNNKLSDSLPSFDNSLQYIDLSNNSLSGSLSNLPKFSNLSFMDLHSNNINGNIPTNLSGSNDTVLLYDNPACSSSQGICSSNARNYSYSYQPFCPGTCSSSTDFSPSIYSTSNQCFCSGYLKLILKLISPPFVKFDDNLAALFSARFAYYMSTIEEDASIISSQVQLQYAINTDDGGQILDIRLYSTDGRPFPARDGWYIINKLMTNTLVLEGYFGPSSLQSYSFVYRTDLTVPFIDSNPNLRSNKEHKKDFIGSIGFIILIVILVLLGLPCIICGFLFLRKRKDGRDISSASNSKSISLSGNLTPLLQFKDIQDATNHFSENYKIGMSGAAVVYKGKSRDGTIWAVKRNFDINSHSAKEYKNEVEILSRLRHNNVSKLVGYCNDHSEQILVFEFMPNGTLWDILHTSKSVRLTFRQRLRIAVGIADGIKYLISHPKIRFSVNSHNILIDNNLQSVVCTFNYNPESSAQGDGRFTQDIISMAYIDPEFITTGKITPKSMVYSFGVVLLELVTGRKPIVEEFSTADNDVTLVDWALQLDREGKFSQIVDPQLSTNFSMESLRLVANIAYSCVERSSSNRPTITDALRSLLEIDSPTSHDDRVGSTLLTSSLRSDETV